MNKNFTAIKPLFLAGLFLLISFSAFAQINKSTRLNGKGIITGIVLDADNSSPLMGANVALYSSRDSSLVTGDVADKSGKFRIEKLPSGNYFIKVNFVGYQNLLVDKILINDANQAVNLGSINVKPGNVVAGEVEVTAQRDAAIFGVDKKVFLADKNIAASGGSALDVMQTIPAVAVDIDGNVSLRGTTSVKILIDNKPTDMTISTLLEQIPASAIDRIEVITNPSAKYEAEGMGGIINIILKKKTGEGFNALISANAGTEDKYNSSINTNLRFGFFNIFANYDNRYYRMSGLGSYNRNNPNQTSSVESNIFNRRGYFHNFKSGFDIFLGQSNSLSFIALYNFGEHLSGEYSDLNYFRGTNENYSNSITDNNENDDRNNNEYTLSYRHNFGEKNHDLTADIFYSSSGGQETSDLNESFKDLITGVPLPQNITRSVTDEPRRNLTFQSDYVLPLAENSKLEAGVRAGFRNLDQDYLYERNLNGSWTNDTTLSNHFIYDEAVYAAYASYAGEIGSFKYQAGLRTEATDLNLSQKVNDFSDNKSYINFFPSIFLKEELSQTNSFILNYSRRIRRPGNWELNPFREYFNSTNYRVGNPDLKPEFINSFELGHYILFGKTSLMSTLFYRYTENMIAHISHVLDSTSSYTTNENVARNDSYGLEFVATQEFMKGWRADASISYFRTIIKSDKNIGVTNVDRDNFSWTAKLNNYINLFGLADLQLMLNYRAPMVTPQGRMNEMFFADLGMKADIIENRLSVNFRLSDIFNTMKFNVYSTLDDGTNIFFERKRNSRTAFLGITYKFNDYKRSPSERKKGGDDNGGGMMDDE